MQLCHAKMKTTLNMDDRLLVDAREQRAKHRASLPVYPGCSGLVQDVDPLSNKAMLAILDDDTDLTFGCRLAMTHAMNPIATN